MIRTLVVTSLLIGISHSCAQDKTKEIERWKQEIIETEHAFAEMAKKEGIPNAFLTFAADEVAVLRGKNLIRGKSALKASYENNSSSGKATLVWSPDFVDVSSSGDLGYTYGKYTYTSTDSSGNVISNEGVFHTVWKRQPDGKWKFVWD
jgi:ketosteroid isomerase-like protein